MFRLFECCALSFFERFVLSFSLKIERFVSDSAEIWICGLYFVAQLHCSIRFSPYLRLQIMGKNINSELSFVGIKHIERLATSPSKNKNIRKVMEKIGKKMTDEILSPKAVEMLQEYSSQIVAMTDLPIEWMMIDGVPLGFTHEVCRLPETLVISQLAQLWKQNSDRM